MLHVLQLFFYPHLGHHWSIKQLWMYEDHSFHFVLVFIQCHQYFVIWYKQERDLKIMHLDIPQICNSHQGWCLCLKQWLIKKLVHVNTGRPCEIMHLFSKLSVFMLYHLQMSKNVLVCMYIMLHTHIMK